MPKKTHFFNMKKGFRPRPATTPAADEENRKAHDVLTYRRRYIKLNPSMEKVVNQPFTCI